VQKNSISTIYVNHPEPVTQTYAADADVHSMLEQDEEPAHMLRSSALTAAAKCLRNHGDGKLIVVTDNRHYARFLSVTFLKVMRKDTSLLHQIDLDSSRELRRCEVFRDQDREVILYAGRSCQDIGHTVTQNDGDSYFDRLWRTGVGTHADAQQRYILALQTPPLVNNHNHTTENLVVEPHAEPKKLHQHEKQQCKVHKKPKEKKKAHKKKSHEKHKKKKHTKKNIH